MSLATRFAATVSVAVGAVMALGAVFLFTLGKKAMVREFDAAGMNAAKSAARGKVTYRETGSGFRVAAGTEVYPVEFTTEAGASLRGHLYRHPKTREWGTERVTEWSEVFIPDEHLQSVQGTLVGLVFGVTIVVILVSVVVAFLAARQGVAPLRDLIEDVVAVSRGRLDHPIRVSGGGEIGLLTRAVDRMIRGLREARDSERSLERREHDLQVAAEVRESLLPKKIPEVPGYELAGAYRPAEEAGGDLYDLLELPGGRAGLLVAEVSGRGFTAGMVMTMARAYLRAEAVRAQGPREALVAANRSLTPDMRRGLFVSVLYAVLEPKRGVLLVASAGPKVPLLRYSASDGSLRTVHPEGIALGFDPGPVFERTLEEVEVPLEPGDRAVLLTGGAFLVKNPEEVEIGEKGVFALVRREAPKNSEAFVNMILGAIERHASGAVFPADVALATVKRRTA